ncbi:lipase 3-like [Palaemon carinicauda]|uniref:lipase 3-like n=1 Tax=Palaemon carinicauda TaxID=392227 RepID=UPI0035B6A7B5
MVLKPAILVLLVQVAGLLFQETRALSPLKSNHATNGLPGDHWGINMTTPELIAAFGYPVEIHHVTTEDGYILELHRIPHGVTGPSENRPVAYLEHCLLCSSSDYIMNYPNEALAYILADSGYDVWLSNMRGNTYSRNHTSLDPEKVQFWKYSWDEMAYYDVPASLDYVLQETGAQGVYYVGWSMGTTVFFAMLSERPEYNEKIKVMAGMAPVTYLGNAKGPIMELAPYVDDIELMLDLLGVGELFPSNEMMDYLAETYCDLNSTYAELCYNFLFLLAGPDAEELNKEFVPLIISHTPAGSSVHTIAHYGQMKNSNKFCKYDFGTIGNINHYGQAEPPLYNLSQVTAPVGLFWGNTDWLADPQDVARLAADLPNLVLDYNVPKEEFNHLDFGWAIHANEYVYTKILELFSSY